MTTLRKSRGRSKLGCVSCRKRRVKCDELYPSCQNCIKKGLQCDGVRQLVFTNDTNNAIVQYTNDTNNTTIQSTSRNTSPRSPNSPPTEICLLSSRSPREIRAFKWLVSRSIADATNSVDRNFWAKMVPRIAQSDDMVWYGVAALSTLFEHPPGEMSCIEPFADLDSGDYYRRQALEWYGRSLQAAHKTTSRSTPILTLSTFIFSCIEMLQGRPQVGLRLMYQAFQINQGDEKASSTDMEILDATLPYLFRCLLPLSIFGFDLSPDQRDRAKPHNLNDQSSTEAMVLQLMIELYDITYQVQNFCNTHSGTSPDEATINEKQVLIDRMFAWEAAVETSQVMQSVGETRRFLSQQLGVYHTSFVRLNGLWSTSPDAFEACEDNFRIIVKEAERCLAFASVNEKTIPFDLSVVPCLYNTAWACRKPSIRRKALCLLRDKAPREENLWTADACIALMEMAIACEEGTDQFIPEVAEVDDVYPPLAMRLPAAGPVAKLQMMIKNVDLPEGLPLNSLQLGLPWKGSEEWPSSPMPNILPHAFWRV